MGASLSLAPGSVLGQPFAEVFWVEADVVSESVVGYLAGACLCEEPCVGDAEEFAGGLRVDQRREARRLDTAVAVEEACGSLAYEPGGALRGGVQASHRLSRIGCC